MFSRHCYTKIRRLEALLYEGPETVEQVFEREDRFQSQHVRRRSLDMVFYDIKSQESNLLYTITYDEEQDELKYQFPEG